MVLSWCVAAFGGGCDDSGPDMSRMVYLYPSASIVQLAEKTTSLALTVRNLSTRKLTNLRLEVKSEAVTAQVEPKALRAIIPGDRRTFAVTLARVKGKTKMRYPLEINLISPDLPAIAGLDLMVDLSVPLQGNWINVGQVTLVSQSGSRTVYYLLAAVPLLFVLGWMLWRWSRPKEQQDKSN